MTAALLSFKTKIELFFLEGQKNLIITLIQAVELKNFKGSFTKYSFNEILF